MLSKSIARPWELTFIGIFLLISGIVFLFISFILLGSYTGPLFKYLGAAASFMGIINARKMLSGCKCARPVYLILTVINIVIVASLQVPQLLAYWLIIPGGVVVLLFTPRVNVYFRAKDAQKAEEEMALRLRCS